MNIIYSILFFAATFVLIFFSALCSAAETAVLAASRVRLYHLAKKGNHKASIVLKLQAHIGGFVSTIILLNTWLNTLVTALATGVLTYFFGAIGALYAAISIGVLITLFAEVLPKMYVYTSPDRVAMMFAPFFKPFLTLMTPLANSISFLAQKLLHLFGINITEGASAAAAADELRGAIDLHAGADYERAMLKSILDLTTVEVTEIMRHRKITFMINIDLPNKMIVDQVLKAPYTRIPVWKENPDNIMGVLHAKDLLRAVQIHDGDLEKLDIEKIATPPWFIPETTTLFSQLAAFRERREHFALVVDEYGDLQGMVTLEDILEEIVGEIVDEHDVEIPGVRIIPDGTYVVDGIVTLRDLNRLFSWSLPDEHAATVAGLVLHETREIPEVGQSFILHGFRIDILRQHRHQITQVRLTPPLDKEVLSKGHVPHP
ncbi:MAG: HlyC/CorC family transporter [Alphaproteobacteria bacterium]|nr:HlyC/CorC family transporter [Alphaproteobacteria bacterium]